MGSRLWALIDPTDPRLDSGGAPFLLNRVEVDRTALVAGRSAHPAGS